MSGLGMRGRGALGGLVLVVGAAGLSIGGFAPPASAQPATTTLYVSTSGTATTGCTQTDPCATIQDAIAVATGGTYNGDDVTIEVAAGTYRELDTISASNLDSLTIVASGTPVKIDGGGSGSVLTITDGNVTLRGLKITGGQAAEGGGIDDTSSATWTTTIDDDIVTNNTATVDGAGLSVGLGQVRITGSTFTNGSDIASQGDLTVAESVFAHNSGVRNDGTYSDTGSTYRDNDDGALFNENGQATLVGDTFAHDEGGSMFGGGGVDNLASLTDTNSLYSHDSSPTGGGLVNFGSATLTGDSFVDDTAPGGIGGGVVNAGDLDDSYSTYRGDSAGNGGGIYTEPGPFELIPQTQVTDDTFTADMASASGGAIDNNKLSLTVSRSTLVDDDAVQYGGGIANEVNSTATMENDTLFEDTSDGTGGGVFNAGSAALTDVTLSSDSAAMGGDGIYDTGTATIADSILNSAGCGISGGSVTDDGYNVESDDSCGFGSTSLVDNGSINLSGRLAAHGSSGPKTLSIRPTSSAFEEVPPSACVLTTDERGQPRPGVPGQNCDAGAFEYAASTST